MSHQQPNAPPPYDSAQKYSAYPDINMQGDPYQPNMQNPYPQQQAPQQPAPTTTYVYVNDGQRPPFGPQPQNAYCPTCQQQVLSKVKHSAGLLTWLVFGGCLIFGCWLGCCLLPFCMDDCQDCEHFCSNCNTFLGQYKRL
uniref:LITAF domain-containing protein n=3 Tax=Meloidogyne TaxID=189290 RepID=A0A6V7UNL7_MELEN|nr:unnamed protein product [Meloidogyne enterolobii]